MNFHVFVSSLSDKEKVELKLALYFKPDLSDFMEYHRVEMSNRLWSVLQGIDDKSMDPFSIDDHFLMKRRNVGRKTLAEFNILIKDYKKQALDASNKNQTRR